ncbi:MULTISPECIES: molybdopterin-dependent oxidoreductase [Halolamina]|uniref:Oxidoreductase molybdopterin binding domain-containing protein n=1 Tax=Halolamina pelagica TaxID=699431 RepID=A0A1I5P4K5_9EURY|nr:MULTISPECIES: molybdopterin-dependent oxidoreductase [Halolamina]NHX36621.1 molybdopterin-dependent oxidoreductase [Halolamina sp. R1-12]SFP28893.1 Oxidoreductase molybdopterin binding domain-containing protein [Halolamina pelagica]
MAGLPSHDVPEEVTTDDWTLTVRGSVGRPRRFDADDLAALPTASFTGDFDCEAGWIAKGLSWRGVRVGDLLDMVDPTPASQFALVHAMDGDYACSFRLDRLEDAVLALELDGEPLPTAHGGPARLVQPADADCWESVKWVDTIELTTEPPDDTAREIALGRVE